MTYSLLNTKKIKVVLKKIDLLGVTHLQKWYNVSMFFLQFEKVVNTVWHCK